MPKLTIDGKEIEVAAGTTVIQAAEKLGIMIPRYCYHPALPIAGNCRICLVEIEKQPKMQIACYTPVAEGMVVKTNSQKVLDVRKTVLEFLLVNHPVDCPVCDQAGECKLQDYYMEHGRYTSRLDDVKVKKEKKAVSLGPTVMLDQERCILCTRCVRFADTITKTSEFGVFNRGDHSQLDLQPGKILDNNYSGNVVDICPVGALTDKDFRFKCRVWYLSHTKSVCPGCSMGCNIDIDWDKSRPHQHKKGRVMRLKPRHNPEVNNYWICDTGRYDYHFIDENRIQWPQYKGNPVSWAAALEIASAPLKTAKGSGQLDKIGVLCSAQLTNEDLFAARKLFKDTLKGAQVDFKPVKVGQGDDFLLKADRNPNSAGVLAILEPNAEAEQILKKAQEGQIDVLYVFGHNLTQAVDPQTLAQIAQKVKLLVYQGSNHNETSALAHLVLPSAVYAEKDGTFTNVQKRVQRIWPAFPPMSEARGDWQILSAVSEQLGVPMAYKTSEAVFNDIAKTVAPFAGLTYAAVGEQGAVLKH